MATSISEEVELPPARLSQLCSDRIPVGPPIELDVLHNQPTKSGDVPDEDNASVRLPCLRIR